MPHGDARRLSVRRPAGAEHVVDERVETDETFRDGPPDQQRQHALLRRRDVACVRVVGAVPLVHRRAALHDCEGLPVRHGQELVELVELRTRPRRGHAQSSTTMTTTGDDRSAPLTAGWAIVVETLRGRGRGRGRDRGRGRGGSGLRFGRQRDGLLIATCGEQPSERGTAGGTHEGPT